MANSIVECMAPAGLALTLELYAEGSDTEAANVVLTESTNRDGYYTSAAVAAALAGFYSANIVTTSGGNLVASGWVYLADTTDSYFVSDQIAGMALQNTIRRLDDLNDFDAAADAVANVTTVASVTALAAAERNAVADAMLSRNVSNVETTAGEHTLCTTILAGLEFSISDTTLTIYESDGATVHATKTLTVSASADPITSVT